MNKKQQEKEEEYFEKMKETILEDIKDGRNSLSIAHTINKPIETLYKYMKLWEIQDIYGEPTS